MIAQSKAPLENYGANIEFDLGFLGFTNSICIFDYKPKFMTTAKFEERPSAKEVFNKYFRTKCIVCSILFIIGTVYICFNRGFDLRSTIFLFILGSIYILFFGFRDYYFYEKNVKKIIFKLLNESPLQEFIQKGFLIEEDDKLCGYINDFNIILSPYQIPEGNSFLTILIPIIIREGLEEYFDKFNELFKFIIQGEVLLAMAVIKNYNRKIDLDGNRNYDFDRLFKVIHDATELLKERDIHPLKVIDD
ncbi:MAG: hypothetical protein ABI203_00830 [Mucilaginibacter sp.]